jgi:hypothetical protein
MTTTKNDVTDSTIVLAKPGRTIDETSTEESGPEQGPFVDGQTGMNWTGSTLDREK